MNVACRSTPVLLIAASEAAVEIGAGSYDVPKDAQIQTKRQDVSLLCQTPSLLGSSKYCDCKVYWKKGQR